MTKQEAYNKMIDGYPVTHKSFSPKEFLWMDPNDYIIRDENAEEFEESWDVNEDNHDFDIGWYIFKNNNVFKQTKKKYAAKQREDNPIRYIKGKTPRELEYRESVYNRKEEDMESIMIGMSEGKSKITLDADSDIPVVDAKHNNQTVDIDDELRRETRKSIKGLIIIYIMRYLIWIGLGGLLIYQLGNPLTQSIVGLVAMLYIIFITLDLRKDLKKINKRRREIDEAEKKYNN